MRQIMKVLKSSSYYTVWKRKIFFSETKVLKVIHSSEDVYLHYVIYMRTILFSDDILFADGKKLLLLLPKIIWILLFFPTIRDFISQLLFISKHSHKEGESLLWKKFWISLKYINSLGEYNVSCELYSFEECAFDVNIHFSFINELKERTWRVSFLINCTVQNKLRGQVYGWH